MKRNTKRLPALLLAIIFCLSLLPATAWAANFPSKFYASVTYKYESNTKYEIFGTVTQSADTLTYSRTGEKMDRVVYGMECAGGVFFTVEGTKLNKNADDGFRELRMYNSDLTSYRTIGTVNEEGGGYWIIDTAMDLSGAEPALYGTYNSAVEIDGSLMAFTTICSISLTDGKTSNWLQVTGLSSASDIIYAMAFDADGILYAIGADGGADGGPATLYTIDLDNVQTGSYGSQTVAATKVADIKSQTGSDISTNFCQDLAFDHATSTLYWMENKSEVLYTLNTESAEATSVGKLPTLQSFCIPYDAAFAGNKHMVSVICEGAGTVTSSDDDKAFYMVGKNGSLTLALTPDKNGKLLSVKVDGRNISVDNLMEYTFEDVTENHVIEVTFRENLPVTQQNMTWFHYQGRPASFYTQHHAYKFYDLPRFEPDFDAPTTGYTQTLLDSEGNEISNDTVILPGNYNVRVTHPGNKDYNALDVVYKDALQLAKCDGTPGRPVVYGKVGCTQGDLTTISALQDYYGTNGELIDSAHDEIPVTLEWLSPETRYDTAGNFYASATIYAAKDLEQRLKDCYDLDDGKPLTEGCLISSRATQVVVLPADEASIIKLQTSDASGGTVSGKGVYKNGDEVTVTATVNSDDGYEFKGWQENGETVSENLTYEFKADGDRTLTALFETDPEYRVTLQADPQDGGTVTGGGNYKEDGHNATVNATANQGYYFIGWYDGDTLKDKNAEYAFVVEEDGITLTAKFGIDYLARAEQAKANFESALGTDVFEWSTLTQAVDAYKAAADFVENPPSVIENAETRYAALTEYYSGIQALDLSNQGIGSADLAKLALFTGVTELNLSGNKDVTDLTALKNLTALETLDISNTGMTVLDSLITGGGQDFPVYNSLTAKNLSLNSISALANLVSAEDFNTGSVTKWDFTGSTLTDSEENKADVKAIQDVLGDRFTPPTIKTTPTGGGGGGATTYAVTVEKAEHGKVTASPSRASSGTPVTITVTPDEGYELEKLTVTDSKGSEVKLTDKGNGKYTFDMPNTKVEIRAVFRKIAPVWENCPGGADCPAYSYRDVDTSAWYHEAVDYVLVNGLMSGYGNGVFGPNDHLSRAQLCQILYNKEGRPAVTGSSVFTDVAGTAWYADAVIWANANGVVGGYGGGLFGPDDPITREQLAAILWRYAGSPESSHSLDAFTDAGQISDWAMDAMRWANENGVLNGDGSGHLIPRGNATRAHVAQMIQNFLENIGA